MLYLFMKVEKKEFYLHDWNGKAIHFTSFIFFGWCNSQVISVSTHGHRLCCCIKCAIHYIVTDSCISIGTYIRDTCCIFEFTNTHVDQVDKAHQLWHLKRVDISNLCTSGPRAKCFYFNLALREIILHIFEGSFEILRCEHFDY